MIRALIRDEDAHVAPTVDAAVATVRARGLRVSSARRLVLEALFAAGEPVTAEEIAGGLDGRFPRSDLGSVYRNLETLKRLGVVRHLHGAQSATLYAIARHADEGFLACELCGEIRPANSHDVAVIRGAVRKAFGYDASFGSFPIVGVCPRCSEERGA